MDDKYDIEQGFKRAGLRVKVRNVDRIPVIHSAGAVATRFGLTSTPVAVRQEVGQLNVAQDSHGEHFTFDHVEGAPMWQVIDTDNKHKHILLRNPLNGEKLLAGHDESHLFVSEVDGNAKDIPDAIVRLAPPSLQEPMRDKVGRKKTKKLFAHKTARYVRQGEWFFIPDPEFQPVDASIHYDEPLQRDASSRPHVVEELVRFGGQEVFVMLSKAGIVKECTKEEAGALDTHEWHLVRTAVRRAKVYVRGDVSHRDHKTIHLEGWHRVEINQEITHSRATGFLD